MGGGKLCHHTSEEDFKKSFLKGGIYGGPRNQGHNESDLRGISGEIASFVRNFKLRGGFSLAQGRRGRAGRARKLLEVIRGSSMVDEMSWPEEGLCALGKNGGIGERGPNLQENGGSPTTSEIPRRNLLKGAEASSFRWVPLIRTGPCTGK